MPHRRTAIGLSLSLLLAALVTGCGGGGPKVAAPPNPSNAAVDSVADAGAGAATGAAASSATNTASATMAPEAGAPTQPPPKPFANNSLEATSMINDAVDAQSGPLGKCIDGARARHKNVHGKISVEIGIDQEGVLIGVKTPKGQTHDAAMNDCVRDALTGANFPRSHAGVITLKRSFEDQAVYK